MLEKFPFNPLRFGVGFFRLALPVVQFLLNSIYLFLVLPNVVLGFLNLLFIRLVVVNFRMEVQLVPLQVADKCVLLSDELIKSFYLLGEHDDLMLKILDFDFDVSILIKGLL